MKTIIKLLGGLLLSAACICCTHAQSPAKIKAVEYYVDTDPGYGRAVSVSIIQDTVVRNIQVKLNPANYSTGVHFFGIRALSDSGKWSLDNAWLFVKPQSKLPVSKLRRIEFYIDNDPGYGRADTIKNRVINDTALTMINIPVNPNTLTPGVHLFGIRAKDANGKWSLDNTWLFVKPENINPLAKLNRVEYYIDKDPGYGNADTIKNLVINDAALTMVSVPVNPSTLTPGVHLFGIRAKDANGKWSLDNVWLFVKPEPEKDRPVLKQVEYFISKMKKGLAQTKDPGYGKATPVAIDEVTQLPRFRTPVNVSGYDTGSYRLYIRSRDGNGAWSLDNTYDFTISAKTIAPSIVVNSVSVKTACSGGTIKVSCDIRGDFNNANFFKVQLSDSLGNFDTTEIGSVKDTVSRIIPCQLPAHLNNGSMYKIRVISTNPALVSVNTLDSITVHNSPYAQTISGPSDANTGTSYSYTVPATAGSTWRWIALAATITPTGNTANVIWDTAGTQDLKVVEKDSYGCYGDTSSKKVNVYKSAIEDVTIADLTPCPGQATEVTAKVSGVFSSGNVFKAQLSSNSGSFSSYKNIGSITAGNTGSMRLITIPVNLGSVANGSKYRVRIVSTSPVVTSANNGKNIVVSKPNLGADTVVFVCPGGTANLTALYNTNGYSSVVWSTANPQSASAGSYTLKVANQGGCSDTAAITVNERMNPSPVINPAGNVTICPADSVVLSVTNIYAAYLWNSGQNTKAINVKTKGSYNVTVTDSYGCQGTSASTVVRLDTCGRPVSLAASSVTGTGATFSWSTVSCAMGYEVRYQKNGASSWTTVSVNSASVTVTGLSVSTKYKWQVLTVCKDGSRSSYSAASYFTTHAQFLAQSRDAVKEDAASRLRAYVTPNPAASVTTLHIAGAKGKVQVALLDVQGKVLWQNKAVQSNNPRIPLEALAKGVYLLTVADEMESLILSVIKE